jgi:hypothetical protein
MQGKEAQEHEDRTEQGVKEELDRSVLAVRATPDADHEVHGDQHDLPEDEEQHQVESDEGSRHARFQEQHEGQERLRLTRLRNVPAHVDDAEERHQQRQDEQRESHPVDADVVIGADLRDPFLVQLELQRPGVAVIELEAQQDPDDQGDARDDESCGVHQLLFGTRDEQQCDGADGWQERRNAQSPIVKPVHSLVPPTFL